MSAQVNTIRLLSMYAERRHRSIMTPMSPSAFFVPVTPQPLTPGRKQQRLESLAHCLASSVPVEAVYPSFGQVCSEAETITSFLDLYHRRALDDASLRKVKSPTSRDDGEWSTLGEIAAPGSFDRQTRVRRSRSLSDLGSRVLMDAMKKGHLSPIYDGVPMIRVNGEILEHGGLSEDRQVNEKRETGVRRGYRSRPRELALSPLPPPLTPLPSPPPPSALLTVQSPKPSTVSPRKSPHPRAYARLGSPARNGVSLKSLQASYWIKSAMPARTAKAERRQGWGGREQWHRSPVVGHLREM